MEQVKQIKIISKPPSLATDGNGVIIKGEEYAEVMFFQIANEDKDRMEAIVTGSFRMSIKQLQALEQAIKDTLTKHEEKKLGKPNGKS